MSALQMMYEDEWITLWHGDFRSGLGMLAEHTVDAIITDPPYGETNLAWDRCDLGEAV